MDSGINSEDWDYEDLDREDLSARQDIDFKNIFEQQRIPAGSDSDSEVSNNEISGKHLDSINNGDGNPRLSEGEMGDKETDSSDDNYEEPDVHYKSPAKKPRLQVARV